MDPGCGRDGEAGVFILFLAAHNRHAHQKVSRLLVGRDDLLRRPCADAQPSIQRVETYLDSGGFSGGSTGAPGAGAVVPGQQPSSEIVIPMKNFLLGLSIATVVICGFLLLEKDRQNLRGRSRTELGEERYDAS